MDHSFAGSSHHHDDDHTPSVHDTHTTNSRTPSAPRHDRYAHNHQQYHQHDEHRGCHNNLNVEFQNEAYLDEIHQLRQEVRQLRQQAAQQQEKLQNERPQGAYYNAHQNTNHHPQANMHHQHTSHCYQTHHQHYDPNYPQCQWPPIQPNQNREGHPFTPQIMTVPLPANFKTPSIDQYDGAADPEDHLEAFRAAMLLSGAPDAIMCRAFSITLKKAALRWFTSLRQNSVVCFDQLAGLFLTHFATSKTHRKTSASLVNLAQGEQESLKNFLSRFNRLALEIKDLQEGVAVHAIVTGLRHCDFSQSLARRPATSMAELLQRAEKFINAEEIERAKKGKAAHQAPPRLQNPGREPRREDRRLQPRYKPQKDQPRVHLPPAKYYPTDNVNIAQTRQWSGKKESRYGADDKNKYCRFHRIYGHDTRDCVALKEEIEQLTQRGKPRWERGEGTCRPTNEHNRHGPREEQNVDASARNQQHSQPDHPAPAGVIEVIAGGFAGGGSSNNARKKSLREVMGISNVKRQKVDGPTPTIIFTDEDYGDIIRDHDDPMVITAMVHNWTMKRILVDQGSSADILFEHAYKALAGPESKLTPYNGCLIGFAGKSVTVEGSVRLRLSLGEGELRKDLDVDFLVVKSPGSAYNAILGRPVLNKAKAIVSTPHLLMKFPVAERVGQVRGNQEAARRCYFNSLKPGEREEEKEKPAEVLECEKTLSSEALDPRSEEGRELNPKPEEKLEEI